jgi:hypothetical protein
VELPGVLGDGARWALVAVFALAAAEKAETLLHGAAAWHPVILAHPSWRRRAAALMGTAFLGDVVAVGLLVASPVVGGLVSAVLVGSYTVAAHDLPDSGEGCRCLWKVLEARTWQALVARNSAVAVLAIAVAVFPPRHDPEGLFWGLGFLLGIGVLARGIGGQ